MVDLSKVIKTNHTAEIINTWYEDNNQPRTRLGLSEIGHPCLRYLWYKHHGISGIQPQGRILRLFQLGNILETQITADLRSAGHTITDDQKEINLELYGTTLYGHIDGFISGLKESSRTHLLEIKTASEKSFNALKKCNSYEIWQPKYKMQIHAYMLGLKLKRCLAVVYNKNTSELYTERIRFDREWTLNKLPDIYSAIGQDHPPERKCPAINWWESRFCAMRDECWEQ
ncbi:MAG: hypothetical protein ACT6FC_06380 [Methanosarcinaceae archaeon]